MAHNLNEALTTLFWVGVRIRLCSWTKPKFTVGIHPEAETVIFGGVAPRPRPPVILPVILMAERYTKLCECIYRCYRYNQKAGDRTRDGRACSRGSPGAGVPTVRHNRGSAHILAFACC